MIDESHDDLEESHEEFTARYRKMSSAGYRPVGFENIAQAQASSFNTTNVWVTRKARRKDVLNLVALGRKDSEIADELGIAEDTVRTLRISRM